MNYYLITNEIDKICTLLPGRTVYPMHQNDHKSICKNSIYESNSGLVILNLSEIECVLLEDNGFSLTEILENTDPLWDGLPTVVLEDGKQVEYYKSGGVATKLPNTTFGFGREINVAPIYNTGLRRVNLEKYHSEGLKGQGVKVGCIAGELTLKVPKDYGVTIKDTYSFMTSDNKIPATNLTHENHGVQCITLIGGQDEIVSIAPDAELYVASENMLPASVDWLLQQGCDIIYISFITGGMSAELAAKVAQKGAILCIAGGNDASNVMINPTCYPKSVNVGYFRCGISNDGTTIYDESITSNALENMNLAKLDFLTVNQYLTYWFEDDVRRASIVYGTSTSVVIVAGILTLLKQKYPTYPMRTLVQLLKLRNRENISLQDYPINVIKN